MALSPTAGRHALLTLASVTPTWPVTPHGLLNTLGPNILARIRILTRRASSRMKNIRILRFERTQDINIERVRKQANDSSTNGKHAHALKNKDIEWG